MKTIEEIKKKLDELKPILEKEYKVKTIGIFGSYIRNEQSKKSDLDILIEFQESAEIGLLEFVHIENFLSDNLGIKVDLVMKSTLKPYIGKQILQEVLYL